MINTTIQNLHDNIVNQINESGLPIAATYYILKDILNELATITQQAIEQEQQQAQAKETDEENLD